MSSYTITTLSQIQIPKPLIHATLPFIIDDFSLAMHLGVKCRTLWWCIQGGPKLYQQFTIKKSSGKLRNIYNPAPALKYIQKRLINVVLKPLPILDCVGAYVEGKSCRDSAVQHVQKSVVIKIDLADFFPSHTRARVRHFFQELGYSHYVSSLMASICTVKENVRTIVPQGSPASPLLCNLIAQEKLDKPLQEALKAEGNWTYTRYSDDLALSCPDTVANPQIRKIIKLVREYIYQAGYRINPDKLRVQRKSGRQKLLGIVVNQHPNIPKDVYRKYRAVIHNCLKEGFTVNALRYGDEYCDTPGTFITHLRGKLSYFHSINPLRTEKLSVVLKQAVEKHTDANGQLQ